MVEAAIVDVTGTVVERAKDVPGIVLAVMTEATVVSALVETTVVPSDVDAQAASSAPKATANRVRQAAARSSVIRSLSEVPGQLEDPRADPLDIEPGGAEDLVGGAGGEKAVTDPQHPHLPRHAVSGQRLEHRGTEPPADDIVFDGEHQFVVARPIDRAARRAA